MQTMLGGQKSLSNMTSRLQRRSTAAASSTRGLPVHMVRSRVAAVSVRSVYQPAGAPPPSAAPRATYPPAGSSSAAAPATPSIFSNIESMIRTTLSGAGGSPGSGWEEIEGSWVVRPAAGVPLEAVIHFTGGAFVGAVPQWAYRPFLEALAARGMVVIATPYATTFDHLRIADEAQFKYDCALRRLGPAVSGLPAFGIGHSLGSVVQMLISSRYAVQRNGNVLMSFNNRPATDVIPFLSPLIAPSATLLGPLLAQISASPLRSTVEAATDTLRGLSPGLVRQVLPVLEQLAPIYLDVSQGRQEFSPSPEETRGLVRSYYSVPRNLLLRFRDDTIDDTNSLVGLLESTGGGAVDHEKRTLPGDHLRPLTQNVVDIPPPVAKLANQAVSTGGSLLGQLAGVASQFGVSAASGPLEAASKSVTGMASFFGGEVGGPITDNVNLLADEVAAWVAANKGGQKAGSMIKSLPPAASAASPSAL